MPHLCSHSQNGLGEFASSTATNKYAPHTVIEPKHLDINVLFNDLRSETAKFSVTVTLAYSGHADLPVKNRSTLLLNAEGFENLNVTGIEHDVVYSYDGHAIKLFWPKPFNVGDTRQVTIDYALDHPVAGLYFQKPGEIMGADPSYVTSDNESERARYWVPTVDFPTVRTTLTWSITAPEQYTSLANGTLLSDKTENGLRTTRWELDFPCPSYLFSFAVGELIEIDDGEVEGRLIKYYAANGHNPEDVKRLLGRTPEMMRWLQEKVGVKLPWTKYYQLVLPPYGGAMENISLVTWTDRVLQDEIFALEFQTITDTVNVHEMAHSYFGDMLVIRHFEHAWLKESWATYFEACWLEDHVSEDEHRYEMIKNADSYFEECAIYMRPIVTRKFDTSWDMFDAHLYPGGSWRIHMLRKMLGESVFWKGVKLYVETFTAKTVQTSDFQGCLEKVSGLNLTRFFDEWLHSKGFPKLSGTYDYQVDENGVAITIKQTQISDDIPLFAFDLEVELVDDKGNIYQKTLTFDSEAAASTWIQLKDGCTPNIFRVDPAAKVLFQLDMPFDQKVLVNTAEKAGDINNRIRAYEELIKKGTHSALKSVKELIVNEPFYGVRVHAAKALAAAKSAFALEILGKILAREQEYTALAPILNACQVKDENVRKAVRGFLSRPAPLPYRAHAAALIALATQRNEEDLDFIFNTAKDDSLIGQHGIVRAGALKALGYTRNPEALKYVIKRLTERAEPMRSRAQAMNGLSYSAAWQEEPLKNQAIEVLENFLQDHAKDVRFAAVSGLVSLRVTSAYGKIVASLSAYSNDDKPKIKRKLNRLASMGSRSEEQIQKEQLEKLEEKVKKLEDQLQKLLAKQQSSSESS